MSSPTLSQSAGEYIARVRYQNGLEAPQCPPKMVEIPNRANAHLLEPSFISNFTRTDSISLDVDAELGMPLDLLHMAGVFEGNEACELIFISVLRLVHQLHIGQCISYLLIAAYD